MKRFAELALIVAVAESACADRPLPSWPYAKPSGGLPGIAWFGANETGFEVSVHEHSHQCPGELQQSASLHGLLPHVSDVVCSSGSLHA